jgi:hypothetical protein
LLASGEKFGWVKVKTYRRKGVQKISWNKMHMKNGSVRKCDQIRQLIKYTAEFLVSPVVEVQDSLCGVV